MKLRAFGLSLLIFAFSAAAVFGQKTTSVKTQFTSVYTSLDKGCKTLRGPRGTDPAFICKGAPGYQVREYYAAAASYIAAERKGTDESYLLATTNLDFDSSKIKLEWRLANGKPFAVIIRLPKYGDPVGDDQYFGKVIGQELVIKGLKGFDIDASVDAKVVGANFKAREIADKAYTDRR